MVISCLGLGSFLGIPSFSTPSSILALILAISAFSGVNNLLSAYFLNITSPSGTSLSPNFYGISEADRMPYVYIPVDDAEAAASARVFYRSLLGTTTELNVVDEFTENYATECVRVGNCFYCTVNNPGIFFVTQP